MYSRVLIPFCLLVLVGIISAFMPKPIADPPFSGTTFIDPDIITSADPTTYTGIVYAGRGVRQMYDRRVSDWIQNNAFLFQATFDDGLAIEVQVNSEFGTEVTASIDTTIYAREVGRLPNALRKDVKTMWIHKGVQPFGGGNNNILIHTGQAANHIAAGILEEALVHEASHTSLDLAHALAPGWVAAQSADPDFISTYARDNPTREDIAESFLTYLAVKYRSGRISSSLKNTILQTIPNRIAYFDQQPLNLYPITMSTDSEKVGELPSQIQLHQNHPNPFSHQTDILFDLADPTFASLSVSNLKGQLVKTLSNAYLESGNHRFSWDGTDQNGRPVSSGAYLYQLETTRSRITKTLILVR